MHLPGDVIARFSVVFEARCAPVHHVQTRQHLDYRPVDRAAILRRTVRQRRIRHRTAFDILHEEERRSDDARILTEQVRFRHRDFARAERGHHFVLAFDRVCRWQELSRWFSAEHESRLVSAALDEVRRIGLTTAELTHDKRRLDTGDAPAHIVLERADVEAMCVENVNGFARVHVPTL